MVSFTDKKFVRFRDAIFSHNGENIYALSDDSGEFGFISLSSDGVGLQKNITKDGTILRYRGAPSLNGKLIAYSDLENNMFVLKIETAASKKIEQTKRVLDSFSGLLTANG
jgi:tricorn protease